MCLFPEPPKAAAPAAAPTIAPVPTPVVASQAPAAVQQRITQPLAAPDIDSSGTSGPVIGARRLKTAKGSGSAGGDNPYSKNRAKGTSALKVALSLPSATGLNIPKG